METKQKYFAFISYQRDDEEWAKWLAHELEHYHLPSTLNGRDDLPQELRPIFRDIDELSAGNLPQQIHNALECSKHLIVICSPQSARSTWVNKEIEEFISMGKTDKIFPFIIDGIAMCKNADDPEECFPPALRNLPKDDERLGANINENGHGNKPRTCNDCPIKEERISGNKQGDINDKGRDAAVVKIVAGMLGLRFDALWQRYEREKAEEERRIKEQRDNLLRIQSSFLAEKANDLVEQGDSYTARLLALEALPKDLENPDRPYEVLAEMALRKAIASEFTICKGHKSYVKSVSYSPNGKFLVSASEDDQVIIWDAKLGKPIEKETNFHGKYAQFSPDGEQIATIDSYGKAYIWDFISCSIILEIPGYSFISYSSDNKFVVTGGEGLFVNIWSISNKQLTSLQGHQDRVTHAVFSPNNQWVASTSFDKTIRIWHFHTKRLEHILEGHTGIIWRIAISPNSQFIASASDDKTIKVWNIPSGKLLFSYNGHSKRVNSLAFSSDGTKIVSVSSDGTAIIWDIVKNSSVFRLEGCKWKADDFSFPTGGERKSIYDVAFSPDNKSIATSHQDETIRIWNLSSLLFNKTFYGHNKSVNAISYSPNDDYIVSASSDMSIKIWDIKKEQTIMTLIGHSAYISSVEYSPNGQYIVSSSADKTIKIWDAQTGEIRHTLEGHDDFVRYANFSPDSKYIASASLDATIKLWDSKTGSLIKTLCGHTAEVSFVSFSHDGNMLVSASDDNTIIVWDINDGKPIRVLKGHTKYIYNAYFCHDDTAVLSCSLDNSIRFWDLQSGQTISKIDGDTRYIYSAMLSPDEKYIVSSAHGNNLKVWDSKSGTLLMSLEGHESQVNAARFSNNGETIASCSEDKTIRIWQFPPLQQLINDTVLQLKESPLSPEERKKYYLD